MFEVTLKLTLSMPSLFKNSIMYNLQYVDLYFDPRLANAEISLTNFLNDVIRELNDKESGEDIENREINNNEE